MKLDVLKSDDKEAPWYADGLNFTCTQCGNCCTGGPGFVWLSDVEIRRLGDHLKLTPEQVVEQYCRKVSGRWSLRETKTPQGNYDCIFLKEQPADASKPVTSSCRPKSCSIYPVRPLQCRTWPFWRETLYTPESWAHASKRCHGINNGDRHFAFEQIETLKEAQDWPQNPPTSAPKSGETSRGGECSG